MSVRAVAKGIGVSCKKLKLVADVVRGKKVQEALDILRFLPSPAAGHIAKVVKSASASAENNLLLDTEDLRIITITADQGPRLKRFRAKARGRAGRIIKPSSHLTVVVEEESQIGS
jgi:large subunit ribosomal protein L22